jgi:hypothetical protein
MLKHSTITAFRKKPRSMSKPRPAAVTAFAAIAPGSLYLPADNDF